MPQKLAVIVVDSRYIEDKLEICSGRDERVAYIVEGLIGKTSVLNRQMAVVVSTFLSIARAVSSVTYLPYCFSY